jgi:outer membrane protein TolC
MNTRTTHAIAGISILVLAGMALLTLGGCLRPGPIDTRVIAKYHRAMARRNPQDRPRDGAEAFRPAPRTVGSPLEVTENPKTKRPRVRLTLEQAVMRALANSLDIAVVSFDPAVSREQAAEAAAEFDIILFGTLGYQKSDRATATSLLAGVSKTHTFEVGARQKTVTGASAKVTAGMTRVWDNSTFYAFQPRYEPVLGAEITQPLLRDGWPGFNLASLRVARLNYKMSMESFRQTVEKTIADVISAYWALVQARRSVAIQQNLLTQTEETLEIVIARQDIDAGKVQIKQAEAAVERRRAVLIRARKTSRDVQDQLGRLMNDPGVNMLGECDLIPVTKPVTERVKLDATDQLLTALVHSPILEQARLAISMADIRVRVAANQTLPRLDLTLSGSLQGLGKTRHAATEQLESVDYVSYGATLTFEYPVGNRERLAALRRTRLERLKAVTQMQNTVDLVAQSIRDRVREVGTTHAEMTAQKKVVAAAREQLVALKDIEGIRGRLTPEFLSVKLAAQESLAIAEFAEIQAITLYNTAMVELARDTGTVLELNRVKLALPVAIGQDLDVPDEK